MKKIYLLSFFVLTIFTKNTFAQVSAYSFSESAGSYSALLGGTNSTATGDDGIQNGIPIGFSFIFGGTAYTTFSITTNGFIKFGSSITTGASNYTNGLSNTATNKPLIAAIWDDNNRNTGLISYSSVGVSPNKILIVDWNAVNIGGDGNTDNASPAFYQVKLYETTNIIEIIYGPSLLTAGALSASIGLNDNASFLSVTPAATSTASSTIANDAISSTTNFQGKKYTFTPPSCSAPGSISASAITSSSATLNWSISPSASLGYEWAISTTNSAPASGTFTTGLTANVASLTPNTTYYIFVRSKCSASTFSGWTAGSFFTGYCIIGSLLQTSYFDAFATTGGSTNITNNASGYSANGYGDFTSQIVTQQQSLSINFSTTLVGTTVGVAIWVDWDNNLIFEASEQMYNTNGYVAVASGSFAVPTSASLGNHRMRVVMDYFSTNPSPCSFASSSRGEAEDYTINVTAAPSCLSVTSLSSANVSTANISASWLAVSGATNGYEYLIDGVSTDPVGAGTPNASTSIVVPGIYVAGNIYYIHVRSKCSAASFSIWSTISVTIPPNCTTNVTPANMATNVPISPNIAFGWNASVGATSYDLYVGTTNPPTTLVTNVTTTNADLVGGAINTTFYWYVVPKNAGGAAVGCTSSITSFTTVSVCTPSTTNGGTSGDALTDFILNGEASTAISVTGATAIPSPGYIDLTATTTVNLSQGKAYAGSFSVDDGSDNLTIWIDYNNNNSFEQSEIVLNNLKPLGAATASSYSILISPTASVGTHKMRVRNIYNTTPSFAIDACANYNYGEGKDFTVNIVSSGAPYVISNIAGSCVTAAKTTIDASSNNNVVSVPILDASGFLIAQLNANGNSLGTIDASYYRNTSAVRQDGIGQKYLDRNITITPATQPTTGTVGVRYYFSAAELTALQAADPNVTSVASLNCTKTAQACATAFAGSGTFLAQQSSGSFGSSDYYVDLATTSFSTFYLKAGLTVLPTSDELTGRKLDNSNLLDWKVNCVGSTEVTIILERSIEGRTFLPIQQQVATAIRCSQSFTYTDANPSPGINYYRIKIITPQGNVRYTSIVALLNKGKGFELISLAPNPVKNTSVLSLSSAVAGKVDITVIDFAGKTVSKETIKVIAGNNPINMNLEKLATGIYTIIAKNDEGQIKTSRFVKY